MTDLTDRAVLVTGGAGFIGSYLAEELLERGADVVVADDFSRGGFEKISHLEDDIEVRPTDLTTHKGCIEATEGVDDVFHLAAAVGGIHYIKRENVHGLTPSVLMNQHMLEAARINDVDRFLFASSACIYRQEHDDLNLFSEDQGIPADPHSTYGWAKVLGEVACEAYQTDTDLKTGSVRIFNCYGPRESLDPKSSHVIPSLCRKVIEEPDGGSIELFGDGTQERGFIYVTDLVEGMIETIEKKVDGEPINLGNSMEVVSMNELAEKIIEISGKDISIEHDLSKPTGTDKYACDMTKMKEELDWEPGVSLDDGLQQVFEWARSELEGTKPVAPAEGDN
ncbi:NAD-dependent epimerase/dehydratase family protein [Haloarchaeobius sp. HME9146]|uniref:NAD-dependent epimerase/dehydratase family protein n=1 Tax=Haloarchaeobius sp. HME9146 TaxID=2978732 RepID=UPI0021BFD667|nr:NAD-dependent epimerase/dehydratase family protein [Haloarchaeobius sp. HME9146]MCT9098180.1 NAD-dependent epimerase/dehydratase family protein [Haloarchaeobius sp. HME9146]